MIAFSKEDDGIQLSSSEAPVKVHNLKTEFQKMMDGSIQSYIKTPAAIKYELSVEMCPTQVYYDLVEFIDKWMGSEVNYFSHEELQKGNLSAIDSSVLNYDPVAIVVRFTDEVEVNLTGRTDRTAVIRFEQAA